MALSRGVRLGPYEIDTPLGAGGMGEVYRARDTRLDRSVAIKVLSEDLALSDGFRERFQREARTISQLTHPHICTLYDVGEATVGESEGTPRRIDYIVMELLEGESLAGRLARGPLPRPDVFRYGAQIAEALGAAHRHGVVHRDLKPANAFITHAGVKLLDFGVARVRPQVTPRPGPGGSAEDTLTLGGPLTGRGVVIGTMPYMAPEQLAGEASDERTDVWALGCTLYEMATGQRAFQGTTPTTLVAAIVSGQPRPMAELQPLVPPAFQLVVDQCLQKDPAERWQAARDVATQLRWLGETRDQSTRPAPATAWRKPVRFLGRLAVGLAAVIAVVLGLRGLYPSRGRAPAYNLTIPGETREYRDPKFPIVSPDGRYVAFTAWTADGTKELNWVRPLDSPVARPLSERPVRTTNSPQFWFPDSRSVAFSGGGGLWKATIGGGPAHLAFEVGDEATIGPDGTILFFADAGIGIRRPSGERTPLYKLDPEVIYSGLEFLPDGRRFLFTGESRERNRRNQLFLGDLQSSPLRTVGEVDTNVRYSPTGHLVFARDATLVAVTFDARAAAITGEPRAILDDVLHGVGSNWASFDVSDNGVVVAEQGRPWNGRLHWVGPEGGASAPVGEWDAYGFRIARNGRTVLLKSRIDPDTGKYTYSAYLWLWDLANGTRELITGGDQFWASGVLSSDAKRLYYTSDRDSKTLGLFRLQEKTLSGSRQETVLLEACDRVYDVSPDGDWLLFSKGASSGVWALPLNPRGQPRQLSESGYQARFSPDGRWIAYAGGIMSFPNGTVRVKAPEGYPGDYPLWSPDGRRIFTHGRRDVYAHPFDPKAAVLGPQAKLFDVGGDIMDWDVAPDGRFLMALSKPEPKPLAVVVNWPALLEP